MDCARNIITANFSGGRTTAVTAPLWQWDYGQVLCITGLDLPAAFEVHFSTNRTGGVSTVAVGADGQVTIPNVLLTIGKNLNAWIYLSDAQGEGETEYSILIPVKARPMPETYDAEVTGEFDDIVRQVSEYAQTAQTAADNAGASATAAAASADNAAASASAAETAKTAAETAQGKAEDAQAAAETAAQTATEKAQQTAQDAAQSAQSKADAESAAERAEAAQTGAEAAKTDAETAAQGAAASASAASASAASAGQAATSAAQSATAAAGSATTAGNAAQTATTKAGEASASATAAAASASAAQTAQTAAETAATNAGQSASTATTKAAEAAQSASNAAQSKTDAEAAATRAETAAASLTVDSALSDSSVNPVQNKVITEEVAQVKNAIDALKIVDTASGAIVSIPDGSANPIQSLSVSLSPIQEGSGDPSPDNIRPITGRTAVTVTRTGVNIFDGEVVNGRYNQGEFVESGSYCCSKNPMPCYPGMQVYFRDKSNAALALYVTLFTAAGDFISTTSVSAGSWTIPAGSGARWFKVHTTASVYTAATPICIALEAPSAYAPYDGTSVTVQLGQTVYGGTIDVTTGVLTVDRAMVDLGSFDWISEATDASGQFRVSQIQMAPLNPKYSSVQCSMLKGVDPKSYSQFNYGEIGLSNAPTAPILRVRAENFIGKTEEEIKAIMQGQQLVYELATPLEITLDPATLSTLKGQNNVWSDGDSVSVEYVADPKLYIARMTEPDADMVADANIVNGQYFMVGNNLYLATANIASGANIVPGVNCTKTNLASALNTINS